MNRFRKILWLLSLITVLTASSAVTVFAESGTVFTFTIQEDKINNNPDESNGDTVPATGDTGCLKYLISAACAGGAAVLGCIRVRSMKNEKT